MNNDLRVCLNGCADYDEEKIYSILSSHFDTLGADKSFFEGKKVVIKPNLVEATSPDHAITTHPSVTYCAAKIIAERGGSVMIAESPGGLYDYDTDSHLDIMQAARIQSIAATQTNSEAIRKAEQALLRLSLSSSTEEKKAAFTFIIDDFTDYHSLDDFKSPEARQLYISWGNKQEQLSKLSQQLEDKRTRYTQSSAVERRKMTDEILHMEQQYEQLETEVAAMPMNIRNLEITYIKK